MLQGTFETLSLPEVLGLLSSARKSGALWLEAGPISGVIQLQDGHCSAVEGGEHRGPVAGAPELLARLVEVCFAVMCQESGSFRLAADEPAPWSCREPVELSDALVEVDRLLKQWREILRVIPSLECRPRLLDALHVDELVVDRDRWGLLVAIDGRRTVRELVQRMERPVRDVCHTLLELIEAGAVGVIDPAAARVPEAEPAPASAPPAPALVEPVAAPPVPATPEHRVEPVAVGARAEAAPAADATPEPAAVNGARNGSGPAGADDPAAHELLEEVPATVGAPASEPAAPEHTDRGAFLRLFSGLRES